MKIRITIEHDTGDVGIAEAVTNSAELGQNTASYLERLARAAMLAAGWGPQTVAEAFGDSE